MWGRVDRGRGEMEFNKEVNGTSEILFWKLLRMGLAAGFGSIVLFVACKFMLKLFTDIKSS